MESLNRSKTGKKNRPIKVVQFGEGNFLRAFVDYMIDIANEQRTPSYRLGKRAAVLALFANPNRLLKSGGSGNIIIPRDYNAAIVIPQSCVTEVQNKKFVYTLGKDNKVQYTEIQVAPQNDGMNYVVTGGLKVGDKYVSNGITKLSDKMEIVPITPERYQQKIDEQAKEMSAGDIVNAMKK